jgi:hypothetical protein
LPHHRHVKTLYISPPGRMMRPSPTATPKEIVMRRVTALCAAAIALSSVVPSFAAPRQMQSGYYLIRWDNTGVCQIWNTNLKEQPVRWPSDFKVVSKPVPTFTEAATMQEKMRMTRQCTL